MSAPPRTTAIGALAYYVSHANPAHYDPSNITFGIMEPLATAPRAGSDRAKMAERALAALTDWMRERAADHPTASIEGEGPFLPVATSLDEPARLSRSESCSRLTERG